MKNLFIGVGVGLLVAFGLMYYFSESNTEEIINDSSSENIKDNQNIKANNNQVITPETIEVEDPNAPKLTFEKEVHDFGQIQQGDTVNYTFKFTNTGKTPLIITNAKAGCGCTVPDWPKEPIPPGESSQIEVEFTSKTQKGRQTKTVTITSNAIPNTKVIKITTEILVPESTSSN